MKNIYAFILAGGLSFANAQTTYVSDHFNSPAGEALTQHGWYAHSAAATNPIQITAPGLSWPGYIGSDIGNAAGVTNDGQDINKPFSGNINSGSAYASFLIKVDAPFPAAGSGVFFHYGFYNNLTPSAEYDNISTAFRARTFVTQGTNPNTQFKLGLSFNAATTTNETSDLNIGETYLVVVKYQFIPGDLNDEVSLFVFPQGADISQEPASPAIGPLTGTQADAGALQAVCLRQYSADQNVIVDGIFVKDAWDIEQCIPTTGTDTRTECAGYTWIDGNTYDESNNTATFLIVGGAANGCDSLVTLNLTIVDVNTDVTVSENVLTSAASTASHVWINCDGNTPIPGATSPTFVATVSGEYAVQVTQNGCTETSECIQVTVVGLDQFALDNQIKLFPNPNQGAFTVSWLNEEQMTINIINALGQTMTSTHTVFGASTEMNLNLSAGVYFVEIINANNERAIRRITVE